MAGGALAAGAYGFDRWKAGAAGAALSRSGFEIALSAGAIIQIVEPSLWGLTSFAGMPLTLSVEALTGAALEIALGGSSARLQPGQGLASVTLTPDAGESGALPLRLAAVAGAARFQRVKLELGRQATGRSLRSAVEEERLCRRYHWRREGALALDGYQAAGGAVRQELTLPVRMRTTPSVSFTASQPLNLQGAATITALSAESVVAAATAAATGRVRVELTAVAFDSEI